MREDYALAVRSTGGRILRVVADAAPRLRSPRPGQTRDPHPPCLHLSRELRIARADLGQPAIEGLERLRQVPAEQVDAPELQKPARPPGRRGEHLHRLR